MNEETKSEFPRVVLTWLVVGVSHMSVLELAQFAAAIAAAVYSILAAVRVMRDLWRNR